MIQRTSFHVAVIMDGNGRWAQRRGLPRLAGHHAGESALRRVVTAAPSLGITTLTAYAFSADNWKRPADEVSGLMALLELHLSRQLEACVREGVRLSVIGRRDRIPASARRAIEEAERFTCAGSRLHVRLAIDYSSRDSLFHAWETMGTLPDRAHFTERFDSPDVDLLIRTGGEQRLSDFLLWESAYAELYFTPVMWPDFGENDLIIALDDYRNRQRRFGALPISRPETSMAAQDGK
ncbi:MAG: polyprenyl diphosphate synthase [Bryobacteraceae bacterium]